MSRARPDADTTTAPRRGWVWGFHGDLVRMHGAAGTAVGRPHRGAQATVGLQTSSGVAFGVHVSGAELQKRAETVRLSSGLDVGLETTTSIARMGVFGQYGPWLQGVRPYVEGLLGIQLVKTDTTIPDVSERPGSEETHKASVTPAAGVAAGLEIHLITLEGAAFGVRVEGRHVVGGSADYLLYSEDEGAFVGRSLGTRNSTLGVGLTMRF